MSSRISQFSEDTIRSGVQAYWNRTEFPGRKGTLEELIRYVLAVDSTPYAEISGWLTIECTECGTRTDEMSETQLRDHLCLAGYVLVGCEGYWVVNPNAVGVSVPEWDDWTKYLGH